MDGLQQLQENAHHRHGWMVLAQQRASLGSLVLILQLAAIYMAQIRAE
jgi:hypothetical protein